MGRDLKGQDKKSVESLQSLATHTILTMSEYFLQSLIIICIFSRKENQEEERTKSKVLLADSVKTQQECLCPSLIILRCNPLNSCQKVKQSAWESNQRRRMNEGRKSVTWKNVFRHVGNPVFPGLFRSACTWDGFPRS